MTMPKPSPEFCGRLTRFVPEAVKKAREDYIRARREEGYLDAEIAAALGINAATLSLWTRRRNMGRAQFNWKLSRGRAQQRSRERLKWALRNARQYLPETEIRELVEDRT